MSKFIPNTPLGEDLFTSHSQARIADALCDNIEHFQVIGIDGDWGVGKSNLVRIVEKKLTGAANKRKKVYFCLYDAWIHQIDSQRRALVEELDAFLRSKKIISTKDTDVINAKADVMGTVVRTKSHSNNSFSWETLFLLLAVISAPVVTPKAIQNTCLSDNSIGGLLPFLPFILFVVALVWAFCNAFDQGSDWKSRGNIFRDRLLMAYKKDNVVSSKSEYTNAQNPSAVAFRRYFKEVNALLGNEETLILVIDNMDRLPMANIQEVWTTVQCCFGDRDPMNRIKVIIPFDRKHLRQDDGLDDNVDDYINKTFDVVFRVAQPVMTDWEDYFRNRWENAFEVINPDKITEFEWIKRIYDAKTDPITPRSINVFINEMLMYDMLGIYQNIGKKYLAIFICYKQHILENPLEAMTNLEYLGTMKDVFGHDSGFIDAIASLVYQVPIEKGQEVAVFRALSQAIKGNDTQELITLLKLPSSVTIIEKMITADKVKVEDVICALKDVEQKDFPDSTSYRTLWNMLFQFTDVHEYKESDVQDALSSMIVSLLQHCTNTQAEQIVAAILELLSDLSLSNDGHVRGYLSTISHLDELCVAHDIHVLKMLEQRDVPWEIFKSILEDDICKHLWQQCRITCANDEADKALAELPLANLLDIDYVEELTEAGFDLKKLRERLKDEMVKYPDYAQLKKLWLKYLQVLPEQQCFDCKLNWSILQGTYFQTASKPEEHDMLIEFLCYCMTQQPYTSVKNSIIGKYLGDVSLAKDVCDSIGKYMCYGDCLLKAKEYQDSKLYKVCCLELTRSNDLDMYANVKNLIANLPEIVDWTGISLEELTDSLSEWEFPQIDDEEVERIISVQCLNSVEGVDNKFAQGIRDRVQEYLAGRDENEWEDSLADGLDSYLLEAVRCVGYEGCEALINAVRSYLQTLSASGEIPGKIAEWQDFVNELDSNHNLNLNGIMGVVADNLKDNALTVLEFQFWGEWLLKSRKLKILAETMRRVLNKDVLADATCCAILIRHGEQLKHMYEAAPEDEQEMFCAMAKPLAQNSENHKNLLRKMGLGKLLTKQKPTKTDEGMAGQ
ncbi:MAG: hypothetical protein J6H31_07365 [Butyrivibrio sp.]|nr:hypothetical protein [Butyrivibrio sp.]